MKLTINKALSLQKAISSRVVDLMSLRSEVSTTENFFGSKESVKEPQYDVKQVDKKIAVLKKMLFEIDSAIKESNAITSIDVDLDENQIFEPIS